MAHSNLAVAGGWRADLSLELAPRHGRTAVIRRTQYGPLTVQRAFYPEGPVPHLYLLHPPGGVVGGDQLQIDVRVRSQGQALITTPAAGKFYRSDGRRASLQQRLQVDADACLEWLPQETIVFEGCDAEAGTRVELQDSSRFIGWEMLCLGRPAAGEAFVQGRLRQRVELWRNGEPIWLERARFEGGEPALQAIWGMGAQPLAATLVAVGRLDGLVEQVRAAVVTRPDESFTVTQLNEVLVCRYLGVQAQRARLCLTQAWAVIRPALLGRAACIPRVWNT